MRAINILTVLVLMISLLPLCYAEEPAIPPKLEVTQIQSLFKSELQSNIKIKGLGEGGTIQFQIYGSKDKIQAVKIGEVLFRPAMLKNAKNMEILAEDMIIVDGVKYGKGQTVGSIKMQDTKGKGEIEVKYIDNKDMAVFTKDGKFSPLKVQSHGSPDKPLSIDLAEGKPLPDGKKSTIITLDNSAGNRRHTVTLPGSDYEFTVNPGEKVTFSDADQDSMEPNSRRFYRVESTLPSTSITDHLGRTIMQNKGTLTYSYDPTEPSKIKLLADKDQSASITFSKAEGGVKIDFSPGGSVGYDKRTGGTLHQKAKITFYSKSISESPQVKEGGEVHLDLSTRENIATIILSKDKKSVDISVAPGGTISSSSIFAGYETSEYPTLWNYLLYWGNKAKLAEQLKREFGDTLFHYTVVRGWGTWAVGGEPRSKPYGDALIDPDLGFDNFKQIMEDLARARAKKLYKK